MGVTTSPLSPYAHVTRQAPVAGSRYATVPAGTELSQTLSHQVLPGATYTLVAHSRSIHPEYAGKLPDNLKGPTDGVRYDSVTAVSSLKVGGTAVAASIALVSPPRLSGPAGTIPSHPNRS